MIDETENTKVLDPASTNKDTSKTATSTAVAVNTSNLNTESLALINDLIKETDIEKTKDLTYLFNINQNKKTMVRLNKMNDLLDNVTDRLLERVTGRPDEITTPELNTMLKTIQDTIEREQKQINGISETPIPTPLIQINQQTNSINVGGDKQLGTNFNRDSRKRVDAVVSDLLSQLASMEKQPDIVDTTVTTIDAEPIDAQIEEVEDKVESTLLVSDENEER